MGQISTYTLNQYKECYKDLLERHKSEYDDHDEFTFIDSELQSFYEGLINIEDIEEFPFTFKLINSFTDEEHIEALKSHMEFKDAAIKSNLSSFKIIDFLEQKKQYLEQELIAKGPVVLGPENNRNPFPLIFTGSDNKTFVLFETFTKQHVLDKYVDFSFIFQQMKYHGYISDIKHLKFMDWLHENNYLTESEYFAFKIEKSFRTLKKCAFGTRLDLYLKLQESIILHTSDKSE